ncbi:MAG: TldD/PmbA family protein [Candidatus Cloacimonadales bacterium]
MITKTQMQKAADYLKKHCSADDFKISIKADDEHLTRFAQNGITQHIAGIQQVLDLEVAFDNKTGSARTNDFSESSLKHLLHTAEVIARQNQPDPEFISSAAKSELAQVDNFSAATEKLQMAEMVDKIAYCVEASSKMGAKLSGFSEKHLVSKLLQTKNGFAGFDRSSYYSHSMTIKKGGVETKVSRSIKDFSKFNMENLYSQLVQQFQALQEPVMMEKGKMAVILRPAAVLNWLYYLIWVLDQREADEGMNAFSGQLGQQFFGEKFNFSSTLQDPDLSVEKFDSAGVTARNIDWIKNGVLKNMRTSRYYAQQAQLQANNICNIKVAGGSTSETEMMQMVERGIIINRLWYIRPIDRKTGEWTGLTRDGVQYFENGKIKNSTTNFRWNEIFQAATQRILALGEAEQLEHFAKVPTLLIDDFNLVDVTTF